MHSTKNLKMQSEPPPPPSILLLRELFLFKMSIPCAKRTRRMGTLNAYLILFMNCLINEAFHYKCGWACFIFIGSHTEHLEFRSVT